MVLEEKLEDKLIKSFKELLNDYSFDKITVTMIAERADILRPTFYKYFKDKYELMDYMLYNDITKEVKILIEHNMIEESLKLLFTHILAEEKLYKKLFETTGQNSFEKIMVEQFTYVFSNSLKVLNTDIIPDNPLLTPHIICKYMVLGLTTSIKEYLNSPHPYNVDQAVEAYYFLVSHSIFDMVQEDFKPKLFHNRD
jgi:probable dihydroxyacetone kinase regulator